MKTKYISIVTIMLCMLFVTPDANAKGFLRKFFKGVGKVFVGAAVGYADSKVEGYLPEEQRGTWHDMTRTFNSELGINDSYANAGRNWAEGKKKDSFVDVGEGALSDAGVNNTGIQTALDFARIQNDYNRDIQSGMSTKEACDRRYEKLKQLMIKVGRPAFEYVDSAELRYQERQWIKEEKAWERKYERGIWLELLRRGYSRHEAQMYMNIISNDSTGMLRNFSDGLPYYLNNKSSISKEDSIEYITDRLLSDESVQYKIKEMLDNLNIRDRGIGNVNDYSSNENSFFGTPTFMPEPENKDKNIAETPQETPQTPSKPIVDERANAVKVISGTLLNSYTLNDVELSDSQKADLDQVADKMNKFEDIQINIFGHTCNIGTQKVNQSIGERRARVAKNYLLSKGVSENRIQIESRDFSEPIVDNDTEEHRKQNRRVTFNVK